MAKRKTKKKKNNSERKRRVIGALLFVLALLMLVSLISNVSIDNARITGQADAHLNPFEIQYRNQGGMMGAYLSYMVLVLLGWLAYFIPLGLIVSSLRLFSSELTTKLEWNGFLLFVISLIGTTIYNVHYIANRTLGLETGTIGGYLGERLTTLFVMLLGELGSYVVLGGIVFALLMTYTSITPFLSVRLKLPGLAQFRRIYELVSQGLGWFFRWDWFKGSNVEDSEPESGESAEYPDTVDNELAEPAENDIYNEPEPNVTAFDSDKPPSKKIPSKLARPVSVKSFKYEYPSLELLSDNPVQGTAVSNEEMEMTARMLRETLDTFGVRIDGEITRYPGPVITRYEFKPAAGIKVNQILNLSDDLALALKAKRIRIIAPIPGKAAVGIEIPNRQPQSVYVRDILTSEAFKDPSLILPLALGRTTSGKPYVADLAKMPHLLVAGATGSGKSVCLNVLITSLIYRLHPLHVRFIMIDPKLLELSVYGGMPHLGRKVVTTPKQAERVLTDTVTEMEKRYKKLAAAGVRGIEDYNKKQTSEEEKLPYIIIFVDELADLMMSASSSKMELLITRLAQMARAVGIHLVLATQRPSVDVITGLIKANFPARIAFQVSSKVDSRTIIDANGAEKLLGAGDMLYLASGTPESRRIHGAYISNEETTALVDFIKEQGLSMLALETISQTNAESKESSVDLGDPLFKEACEVCLRHKQGSVSLMQRRLGIGYQRAARLIDKLEEAGIVSPFDGSKARDVIADRAYVDALFSGGGVPAKETSEPN